VNSIPDLGRVTPLLAGEPASALAPPSGCAFHPRCPVAIDACSDTALDVRLEGRPGSPHQVACIERKAG
jgi:peptide/nickel transport system ATP-binding protein